MGLEDGAPELWRNGGAVSSVAGIPSSVGETYNVLILSGPAHFGEGFDVCVLKREIEKHGSQQERRKGEEVWESRLPYLFPWLVNSILSNLWLSPWKL